MRIFLDASVLFSAAKSDGAIRQLLALHTKRGHELCADAYVVEEARRNLATKARGADIAMADLLARMRIAPFQAGLGDLEPTLKLPAKDRPVLFAAIRMNCDALVTGDRTHFGALYGRTIRGVTVCSPRSLAERILK